MGLPIHTARFELRDFRAADEAAVHAYASDPLVTQYLWWGPNNRDQTQTFLRKAHRQASERPRRDFELAIVHRESSNLIGGCSLLSQRQQYREYEVGYCIRKDWWGTGCATEVVRSLVDNGFSSLSAHRIYALVDPENPASWHLVETLGFRREGRQREDTLIAGQWRDTFVYALLGREWMPFDQGRAD